MAGWHHRLDGWVWVNMGVGDGQGGLMCCDSWGPRESDTTERLNRTEPFPSPFSSVQVSSVAQSCPTLCDPMNRSAPGLLVHHQLPEFTQTHVHRVSDAIQPSHPLSSPPFSIGSSQLRDRTQVSHIAGRFFTNWATRGAQVFQSLC